MAAGRRDVQRSGPGLVARSAGLLFCLDRFVGETLRLGCRRQSCLRELLAANAGLRRACRILLALSQRQFVQRTNLYAHCRAVSVGGVFLANASCSTRNLHRSFGNQTTNGPVDALCADSVRSVARRHGRSDDRPLFDCSLDDMAWSRHLDGLLAYEPAVRPFYWQGVRTCTKTCTRSLLIRARSLSSA